MRSNSQRAMGGRDGRRFERFVERGSDFHSLARFLETYVNE
jgi:hypothetical protein